MLIIENLIFNNEKFRNKITIEIAMPTVRSISYMKLNYFSSFRMAPRINS